MDIRVGYGAPTWSGHHALSLRWITASQVEDGVISRRT